MSRDSMEPFEDDSSVWNVGGLSFENGPHEILVHGTSVFARDRESAGRAREMIRFLTGMIDAMGDEAALPERAAKPAVQPALLVDNPFD